MTTIRRDVLRFRRVYQAYINVNVSFKSETYKIYLKIRTNIRHVGIIIHVRVLKRCCAERNVVNLQVVCVVYCEMPPQYVSRFKLVSC